MPGTGIAHLILRNDDEFKRVLHAQLENFRLRHWQTHHGRGYPVRATGEGVFFTYNLSDPARPTKTFTNSPPWPVDFSYEAGVGVAFDETFADRLTPMAQKTPTLLALARHALRSAQTSMVNRYANKNQQIYRAFHDVALRAFQLCDVDNPDIRNALTNLYQACVDATAELGRQANDNVLDATRQFGRMIEKHFPPAPVDEAPLMYGYGGRSPPSSDDETVPRDPSGPPAEFSGGEEEYEEYVPQFVRTAEIRSALRRASGDAVKAAGYLKTRAVEIAASAADGDDARQRCRQRHGLARQEEEEEEEDLFGGHVTPEERGEDSPLPDAPIASPSDADFDTFDLVFKNTNVKIRSLENDLQNEEGREDYLAFRAKSEAIDRERKAQLDAIADLQRDDWTEYSRRKWELGKGYRPIDRVLNLEDEPLSAAEDLRVENLLNSILDGIDQLTATVETRRKTMVQTEWLSSAWSERKNDLRVTIAAFLNLLERTRSQAERGKAITFHDIKVLEIYRGVIETLKTLARRLGPQTHLDSFRPARNYSDRISIDFSARPWGVIWKPEQFRKTVFFHRTEKQSHLDYYNDEYLEILKTGRFALLIKVSSDLFEKMVDRTLSRSKGQKTLIGVVETVLRSRMPRGPLILYPTAISTEGSDSSYEALAVSPVGVNIIDMRDEAAGGRYASEVIPLHFGGENDWWNRIRYSSSDYQTLYKDKPRLLLPGEAEYLQTELDQIQNRLDDAPAVPDTAMVWIAKSGLQFNQKRFNDDNIVQGLTMDHLVANSSDSLLIVMDWGDYYNSFNPLRWSSQKPSNWASSTKAGDTVRSVLQKRTAPTALLVSSVAEKQTARFVKIGGRVDHQESIDAASAYFDFAPKDIYVPVFFARTQAKFFVPNHRDIIWHRLKQWGGVARKTARALGLPKPVDEKDALVPGEISGRVPFDESVLGLIREYDQEALKSRRPDWAPQQRRVLERPLLVPEIAFEEKVSLVSLAKREEVADKLRALDQIRLAIPNRPWQLQKDLGIVKWFPGNGSEFEAGERAWDDSELGAGLFRLAIFLDFKNFFPKLVELKTLPKEKSKIAENIRRMLTVLRQRAASHLEHDTALVLTSNGAPIVFEAPLFFAATNQETGIVGANTTLVLETLDGLFPVFSVGRTIRHIRVKNSQGVTVDRYILSPSFNNFPRAQESRIGAWANIISGTAAGTKKAAKGSEEQEEEGVDTVASALLEHGFTVKSAARVFVNHFVAF